MADPNPRPGGPARLAWWTSGHAAVCLARGCEWRRPAVAPILSKIKAMKHHRETGHETGIERCFRALVYQGVTNARE